MTMPLDLVNGDVGRRCETSSGCRGGVQHLGEYTNTSPSVSGDVALEDPMVGGSPLLTESLLD